MRGRRLAGLAVAVAAAASWQLAAAAPPPPKPPLARPNRIQTTFKSVDSVVAAEWDFPPHGTVPLVVLVPVIGRVDRNGLRPGSDLDPEQGIYAQLTRALVDAGFGVFRYDQPGAGRSSPGRFATDRSTALEGYTKAVAHARVDPDRVFLLGHASGTTTIAAIYPRFAAVQPPAGVVFLDSAVGEYDAARIKAPLLIINPGRDPDNRYRYGEYVVEARKRPEAGRLPTDLVLLKDARPGLVEPKKVNGERVLVFDQRAVRTLIDWLRRH